MDLSGLRPAGGKRSSKRDRILEIFFRQKGHITADELYDLVRREEPGIGRATVYRSLQWMVSAGVAHKVDFGDIDKNKVGYTRNTDNGWVAMIQHYFVSALVVPDKAPREYYTRKLSDDYYAVGEIVPVPEVVPGGKA